MNVKVFYQSHPCNSEALEIKRLMAEAIVRAKVLYGTTKKMIAIDLGVPEPVLSHYLSLKCGFTIPSHLVRRFCNSTRDWTLSRALQRRRIA